MLSVLLLAVVAEPVAERLMAAGAVDFVQPSPAKTGGIGELSKVFPLAAVRNVPVMPHTFYDGPGLLAAIQPTLRSGRLTR